MNFFLLKIMLNEGWFWKLEVNKANFAHVDLKTLDERSGQEVVKELLT